MQPRKDFNKSFPGATRQRVQGASAACNTTLPTGMRSILNRTPDFNLSGPLANSSMIEEENIPVPTDMRGILNRTPDFNLSFPFGCSTIIGEENIPVNMNRSYLNDDSVYLGHAPLDMSLCPPVVPVCAPGPCSRPVPTDMRGILNRTPDFNLSFPFGCSTMIGEENMPVNMNRSYLYNDSEQLGPAPLDTTRCSPVVPVCAPGPSSRQSPPAVPVCSPGPSSRQSPPAFPQCSPGPSSRQVPTEMRSILNRTPDFNLSLPLANSTMIGEENIPVNVNLSYLYNDSIQLGPAPLDMTLSTLEDSDAARYPPPARQSPPAVPVCAPGPSSRQGPPAVPVCSPGPSSRQASSEADPDIPSSAFQAILDNRLNSTPFSGIDDPVLDVTPQYMQNQCVANVSTNNQTYPPAAARRGVQRSSLGRNASKSTERNPSFIVVRENKKIPDEEQYAQLSFLDSSFNTSGIQPLSDSSGSKPRSSTGRSECQQIPDEEQYGQFSFLDSSFNISGIEPLSDAFYCQPSASRGRTGNAQNIVLGGYHFLIPDVVNRTTSQQVQDPNRDQYMRRSNSPQVVQPSPVQYIRPSNSSQVVEPNRVQYMRLGKNPQVVQPSPVQYIRPSNSSQVVQPNPVQYIRPGNSSQVAEPNRVQYMRLGKNPQVVQPNPVQYIRPSNSSQVVQPNRVQYMRLSKNPQIREPNRYT